MHGLHLQYNSPPMEDHHHQNQEQYRVHYLCTHATLMGIKTATELTDEELIRKSQDVIEATI